MRSHIIDKEQNTLTFTGQPIPDFTVNIKTASEDELIDLMRGLEVPATQDAFDFIYAEVCLRLGIPVN